MKLAALTASLVGLWLAAWVQAGVGAPRILFRSDWSGTSEIYAADPTGAGLIGQVTFGRAPACGSASACGYHGATASPNGRYLLYSDWTSCDTAAHRSTLFIARADGTRRRALARVRSGPTCGNNIDAAWSADSTHIAYRIGTAIHVIQSNGRGHRVVGHGSRFAWAPVGRSIAYRTTLPNGGLGGLWLVRGRSRRMLAARAADFAWSPNGRWIAYWFADPVTFQDQLDVVHPDGTSRRTLLPGYFLGPPPWSGDSRFLFGYTTAGLDVVDVATGTSASLAGEPVAWQPHGHVLALQGSLTASVSLYDAETSQERNVVSDRVAEAVWSPDGESLAYVKRPDFVDYYSGDLKVATVSGDVRTIVDAAGDYGGNISELTWTRPPSGTRYRKPASRSVAGIDGNTLTAPWAITRIGTDGDRVAYMSCGHVFVWTPPTRSVVQAEPDASLSPRCTTPGNYDSFLLYSLALSGDRIAFGARDGNAGQSWGLYTGSISNPSEFRMLNRVGSANGCAVGPDGSGDLVGAGGLLVFSTWRDDFGCPATTLEQSVFRVDSVGCPCPLVATSPGPLVPFDVNDGRIVVGGNNATVVLNSGGTPFVSVPVSPLAAQLSGSHLVILTRGWLFDYDVASGALSHAWPMPDVPSGGECGSPHSGTWECRQAQLVLEDAARGLVTYTLFGQVSVLRLADGAATTVSAGTFARFTDTGLVYANGALLHLVPFDQLPIRP